MTEDDQAKIDFVWRWMTFGGAGADDIFTTFGLRPREFYTRTAAIAGQAARSARGDEPVLWRIEHHCTVNARHYP
ncbi:hypothetical protein [Gordonia soli]|uniref:DUF3263 domain-containing protein n=1 Tax=Gordonia soli NBRC 108243 TaxID=1223545 RepID=M0QLN5_9ACTN|nr:hypothetical protein [Gordonia soli]GAC69468.1 hypothetical protein GS4_25_00390 [Gordonia soli NBRC 108243]